MATYYAQRAGAGLIVTEGIQPSAVGQGYPNTPGLHSAEQVAAWRQVTDAVHDAGGRDLRPAHAHRPDRPPEPAARRPDAGRPLGGGRGGAGLHPDGMKDFVTPKELTAAGITDDHRRLRRTPPATPSRPDSTASKCTAPTAICSTSSSPPTPTSAPTSGAGRSEGQDPLRRRGRRSAVADAIGADRVGLRISPANPLNDIVEDDYRETYQALVDALEPLGLAYLHIMEMGDLADRELTLELRKRFSGTFILNPSTPDAVTEHR